MSLTRIRYLLTTLALAGALVACGSDRSSPGPGPAGGDTVGPAGGAVKSDDGALALNIPAGALAAETEIEIRRIADSELPKGAVPGTGFELLPDGVTFDKPVELTLSYSSDSLPNKDTTWLRVVQVLDSGKLGATQFVSISEGDGWVRGRLFHFSKYALADLKVADAVIENVKTPATDVDVLFVLDNSNSMAEEQANLTQNFPKLIGALEAAGFDYRVGVATSDLGAGAFTAIPSCEVAGGDAGKLQNIARVSGCTPPSDPWIEKVAGKTNVPGDDVAAAFSCIAGIGTGGCGFEQQLESAYKALEPTTNPGFLRKDAAFALVVISDEDDCSTADTTLFDPAQNGLTDPLGPLTSFRCFEFGVTCDVNDRNTPGVRQNCQPQSGGYLHPVSRYINQLKALKPNGQVVVSAITGPRDKVEVGVDGNNPTLEPSCQSANGMAVPAVRIGALVDAMGDQGSMHSICDGDFAPALQKIGQLVAEQAQLGWCLPFAPIDTNPTTTELDADCVVIASDAGKLPLCAAGSTSPCYSLGEHPLCGTNAKIKLENIAADKVGDNVYAVCLAP